MMMSFDLHSECWRTEAKREISLQGNTLEKLLIETKSAQQEKNHLENYIKLYKRDVFFEVLPEVVEDEEKALEKLKCFCFQKE